MSINENNLTSFYGNVPYPMELATLSLCSGAPIFYKLDDRTGLDMVTAFVPKINGGNQPVMVTLGNDDSVAPDHRIAVYHSLGLDRIVNEKGNSNDTNNEIIATRFSNIANTMGSNNNYLGVIFNRKTAELREKVLKHYPENVNDYDAVINSYKKVFAKVLEIKTSENEDKLADEKSGSAENSKKKQTTSQMMA